MQITLSRIGGLLVKIKHEINVIRVSVNYYYQSVLFILFKLLPLPPDRVGDVRPYALFILFKLLPLPPRFHLIPNDDRVKFQTALNGKIITHDERFFEVRDLLLNLNSKNKKINQMKIGGYPFSELREIKDLAHKQGQSDSQKHNDTADLTIDHPVLIRRTGPAEAADGNIAHCMHQLHEFHTLLQIHGLRPEQVTVIFWPSNDVDQSLQFRAFSMRFRTFYEKMFGGIEIERIYDQPPQKILLKQALIYIANSEYVIGPSLPHLRDWMTRSFEIEVKTKTHEVKKIVFIDRQPIKFREQTRRTDRMISNMDELCDATQARFPTLSFVRARLELLSIADQIALLADADIVIGAHGAGLVFAAHLVPENAGIIELLPPRRPVLPHALYTISSICRMRGVHYELRIQLRKKRRISKNYAERYGQLDPDKVANYFPPEAIIKKITKITHLIEKNAT